MIAWFLAKGNVQFYKWDEKDWWNYDPDEKPSKNWPSQMFEMDYTDDADTDTDADVAVDEPATDF